MKKHYVWNKNFTLLVIGQIISLFGNAMLRFSLSLYVLDTTGSASAFATILAISMIPTIFLSPVGGVLADRMSRRHIMILLDCFTGFLLLGFTYLITQASSLALVAITMIVLSIIQSFYQPAVQASIPLLVDEEKMMQANGITVQVNALATLLGPILGGVLFSLLPFATLLIISAACFLFSSLLECIMQIPFVPQKRKDTFLKSTWQDLKAGMQFVYRDRPTLFKLLMILALLNFILSSLMSVGLPVISNITLALDPVYFGWLQAGIGIGSIIGAMLLPIFQKRFQLAHSYIFLMLASLFLFPIGLAIMFLNSVYVSYAIVFAASILCMAFAAIFNIYAQTYLQQNTPNEMLGKVSSFVTMIVMCTYPLGQAVYGVLFDVLDALPYLIFMVAAFISIGISLRCRSILKVIE